jgi:UPF0716 family protein affecting phage T7 exclusion
VADSLGIATAFLLAPGFLFLTMLLLIPALKQERPAQGQAA